MLKSSMEGDYANWMGVGEKVREIERIFSG